MTASAFNANHLTMHNSIQNGKIKTTKCIVIILLVRGVILRKAFLKTFYHGPGEGEGNFPSVEHSLPSAGPW